MDEGHPSARHASKKTSREYCENGGHFGERNVRNRHPHGSLDRWMHESPLASAAATLPTRMGNARPPRNRRKKSLVDARKCRGGAAGGRASERGRRACLPRCRGGKRATPFGNRATAHAERTTARAQRTTARAERATARAQRTTARAQRATARAQRATTRAERATARAERAGASAERRLALMKRFDSSSTTPISSKASCAPRPSPWGSRRAKPHAQCHAARELRRRGVRCSALGRRAGRSAALRRLGRDDDARTALIAAVGWHAKSSVALRMSVVAQAILTPRRLTSSASP
jgi:hypothetical protein